MFTNELSTTSCISYNDYPEFDNDRRDSVIYSRNMEPNEREDRTIETGDGPASENGNGIPSVIIYRYKFTEDFMLELYNFSKIHQYDHRKEFKEAWKIWTEENNALIEEEVNRLTLLGYEGDVFEKMFKSARYYFRKKSPEKPEPKQRRPYISVNRELLDAMDQHIEEHFGRPDYQPKTGFVEFCKDNESILKETIASIFEKNIRDLDLIQDKVKKTYKNRYFMFTANKK